MKKRILNILLAALMIVSLLPATALAGGFDPQFDPCNGSAVTDSSEAPTWEGTDYVFAGWYTRRTGGEKKTAGYEEDQTYYAHWWTNEDEDTLVLTEGLLIGSDGNLFVGSASSPVSFTNPEEYGLAYADGTLSMENAVIDTCVGFVNGTVAVGVLYQDTPTEFAIALTGDSFIRVDTVTQMDQTRGVDAIVALKLDGSGSLTVTAGNAKDSSYGVRSSGTLTNNAELTATAGNAAEYSSGVQVSVAGSDLVNNAGAELNAFGGIVGKSDAMTLSTGVRCEQGSLTNYGTLNATAGTALTGNSGYSYGVYCDKGNLTNNGELEGTAVNAINNSGGVYCAEGTVTNAEDAEMTGISGNVSDKNGLSVGIYSYITLTNNGDMTGTGGKSTGSRAMSAGIYCSCDSSYEGGNIANSGTMAGTGGESPNGSCGIYADYWLRNTSETGTITGTGGSSGYSQGIYAAYIENLGTMKGFGGIATEGESYGIEIWGGSNDGEIIAEGGTGESSYGIDVWDELMTNNGRIEATGGTATEESCGLKFEGGDIINSADAELIATGGEVTGEDGCSYGVYSESDLFTNSGTLNATGGEVTGKDGCSYGFYSESDCVTNSGTLTADGGEITNDGACSCGMYCRNWGEPAALTNSGRIEATGGTATGIECYSYGIYFDSCTLTNDDVLEATGGAVTGDSSYSYGIYGSYNWDWGNEAFLGTDIINSAGAELTAKAGNVTGENGTSCGVLNIGDIENSGEFTATAGEASSSYGIYGYHYFDDSVEDYLGGDIINNVGAEMKATAGTATGEEGASFGVACDGNITNDGTLNATGGKATGESGMSYGVSCGSIDSLFSALMGGSLPVSITNTGTFTATADEATGTNGASNGVFCYGNVTNSGTLTATSVKSNGDSIALGCYGDLINGATDNTTAKIEATAGDADGNSIAVNCFNLTNYGTLDVESGKAGDESYGVYCIMFMSLPGTGDLSNYGTITAAAGTSDKDSYGVFCSCNLINGATDNTTAKIEATAGETKFRSYGVICSGVASGITNFGTLIGTSGDSTGVDDIVGEMSFGVSCYGNLTNNGAITATAGNAVDEGSNSYGLSCWGNLTNDGTINAASGNVGGIAEMGSSDDIPGTSCGVYVFNGALTNTGTITATAGNADDGSESYGVYSTGNVTNNAILVATAGDATTAYGVYSGAVITVVADGAAVSYGEIEAAANITAVNATATGAKETLDCISDPGTTTTLTQSDTATPTPIVICFGAIFDPCNGEALITGFTAPDPAPTWEGYIFDGWYTKKEGGEKVKSDFEKGTFYYAHWKEEETLPIGGGDSEDRYTIEKTATKNGSFTISGGSAEAGKTVTITVTPDEGYVIDTITVTDRNGKEIALTNAGDNRYTFTMPDGAVKVSVTFKEGKAAEEKEPATSFADVKQSDYFCDAVLWAAENGVTKGMDSTHFGPDIGITRAQVVTFLWRASGCPEPTGTAEKFTDLKPNEYYQKAVAWAIEQGITKGTSATTFGPEQVCTRAQIVTFLARFAGVEDADTESVFSDVRTSDYFAAAVKWAKDNGVTEGTSVSTFSPNADCTRAQVVTFLYRWMVR